LENYENVLNVTTDINIKCSFVSLLNSYLNGRMLDLIT